MAKSNVTLANIFSLMAGGNPPSISPARFTTCMASNAQIMVPAHGINPIIAAHPNLNPQILNCKSNRYALRLTDSKTFKSLAGTISGSFLFLFAP